MEGPLYIGVDIGGTNVKVGLVDAGGTILALDSRETLAQVSADAPVDQIAASIEVVLEKGGIGARDIVGVGIGTPGPISAAKGTVLRAGNLPHWFNFPLAAKVSGRVGGKPAYIQNDATIFAYGEWWMGAGRGVDDFFAITLGTGIGGGAVSGGRLLTGFNDNACEFGHTTVDYDGYQCWCGQRGCIELYASATGLVRITNEALINDHIVSALTAYRGRSRDLNAQIITEAAAAGDEFARDMLGTAGRLLGIALLSALNILNFKKVAVGGGLAKAGEFILGPARRAMNDRGFQSYIGEVSLVTAEHPGTAAILGAVKLVMDKEGGS